MAAKHAKAAGCCSECPNRLVDSVGRAKPAGTKTCSKACRQARARRLKRVKIEAGQMSNYTPEHQQVAAAVRGEAKDAAHEVLKEELRPLVREAMTEDVLGAISSLIKLTPAAIVKLEEQMASDDEVISQRAVTLLLKYTMGNPSVAPTPTVQAPAPMTVTFNVPRPGDDLTAPVVEVQADDVEELRECTDCHESKTAAEFVGASPRCQECFDGLHDTLRERFAEDDTTAP